MNICQKCVEKDKELAELKKWVDDLQSGMFINCVYCGHRYGPKKDTPVAMADVLKAHIEKCPKHPMSQLRTELAALKTGLRGFLVFADDAIEDLRPPSSDRGPESWFTLLKEKVRELLESKP